MEGGLKVSRHLAGDSPEGERGLARSEGRAKHRGTLFSLGRSGVGIGKRKARSLVIPRQGADTDPPCLMSVESNVVDAPKLVGETRNCSQLIVG